MADVLDPPCSLRERFTDIERVPAMPVGAEHQDGDHRQREGEIITAVHGNAVRAGSPRPQ